MKVLRAFFTYHHSPKTSNDEIRYSKEKRSEDFSPEISNEEAKFILSKKYGVPPKLISLKDIIDKAYPSSFIDGITSTITEDSRPMEKIGEEVDAWDSCLFGSIDWKNTYGKKPEKV